MLSGISEKEEIKSLINKNRNQKRYTLTEVNNLLQLALTALAELPRESLIFKNPYNEKWAMYFHRTVGPHLSAANQEEFDALVNRVNKSILKMKTQGKLQELQIQHIWAHFVKDCLQNGNILKEADAETGASWTILAEQLRQLRNDYPAQFVGLKDYDRLKTNKTYQRDEEITNKIQQIYLAFMGQLEKNGSTGQVQAFHNFLHVVTVACSNEEDICSYLATNINCCLLIGMRLDYHLCQLEEIEITQENVHTIPRVEYDFMACFTYAILKLDLFKSPYNGAMYRRWQQDSIPFQALSTNTTHYMWHSADSPLCIANTPAISKKSAFRSMLSHFGILSIDSEAKKQDPTTEKPKSPRNKSPRKLLQLPFGLHTHDEESEQQSEKEKKSTHSDKPKNLRERLKRQPLSENDLHTIGPKMPRIIPTDSKEKEASHEELKPKPPLSDYFIKTSLKDLKIQRKPVLPDLPLKYQGQGIVEMNDEQTSPRHDNAEASSPRNYLPFRRGSRIRSPRGENSSPSQSPRATKETLPQKTDDTGVVTRKKTN